MWACDRYVVFFLVLGSYSISYGSGKITNKIVKEVENMRTAKSWNEESCSSQGGICIPSSECPNGQAAALGLCPEQQENGIECCHGLPISETNCERRGGVCRSTSDCPSQLMIPNATSCQPNKTCCALVR